MVGDSLDADMQGAINYGIDCCWCNFGGGTHTLPVTYVVDGLDRLIEQLILLARLSSRSTPGDRSRSVI